MNRREGNEKTRGDRPGSRSERKSLYERAGIADVAGFYRTRYVSGELLDARYFDALRRFDIRWSRTMWVYDNVRPGSTVLDLGCGAGVLALLKRKGVTLVGADISRAGAKISRRNGYDATFVALLDALPFGAASFDYVVTLDVLGHVEAEDKDAVLAEVARVLKPGGVTLHGVECLDRTKRKGYDEMSEEELRRYVQVDGHVGMEDEQQIIGRFGRFFGHMSAEPRYSVCQSRDELLKQADEYGTPLCDRDFLDYLRGMSFRERRAFDMAMGYVFGRISEMGISMPASEYLFLKASDAPLGPFYAEHGDRHDLFPATLEPLANGPVCLDLSTHATFDAGWYEAEVFPPVARWMAERARVLFNSRPFSGMRMDIISHLPDLAAHPLGLEFFLNGERVLSISVASNDWAEVRLEAPASCRRAAQNGSRSFELEIRADRTWRPRPYDQQYRDDRDLSIAVSNIRIFP
ncbi:MAG TPA: class I SAM-dependent methyltransferase [Pyrinomonadaceae bacterium]